MKVLAWNGVSVYPDLIWNYGSRVGHIAEEHFRDILRFCLSRSMI